MRKHIRTVQLFFTETIAASGSSTTDAIDLEGYLPADAFSIQMTVAGDGTAQVDALMSSNNVDFVIPEGASALLSAKTKTSGPGSDGKFLEEISPEAGRYMKLKVSETGTSNSITVSLWLTIQ